MRDTSQGLNSTLQTWGNICRQDPPGGIGKSNGRVGRKKKEIPTQRKRNRNSRICILWKSDKEKEGETEKTDRSRRISNERVTRKEIQAQRKRDRSWRIYNGRVTRKEIHIQRKRDRRREDI